MSIDYAVHFFVHWKAGVQNVRSSIIKGLLLGFLTTELSYIALSFAEFSLLRQMAVFSIVGLLSAFLTITFLFHAVFENSIVSSDGSTTKSVPANLPTRLPTVFLNAYAKIPKWGARLMLVLFIVALLPGLKLLNVHTDIGNFYTMNEEIKASEALTSKLNNLGIAPSYFIVEGNGENDVLEMEEQLTERLANAEKEGLVKSYLATSNVIPPEKYRIEHYVTFWKLFFGKWSLLNKFFENKSVLIKPNVRDYLTEIGVENDSAFVASLDLSNNITMIRSLENDSLPQTLHSILQMLWIGNVGDKYYSAVLPLHVSDKFDAQKIAEGLPGVHVVNKKHNINNALTKISQVSLKLVGFAYVAVFFILIIVYKFKDAVRIIRAPVLASLFAASVFGFAGIEFNFFAIVGVILTLGIGIDYALFFKEGGRQNLTTTLAIMLSAMTTIISFGSLACSAFVPIKTFGFVVLLGISCCFLLSPFSRND